MYVKPIRNFNELGYISQILIGEILQDFSGAIEEGILLELINIDETTIANIAIACFDFHSESGWGYYYNIKGLKDGYVALLAGDVDLNTLSGKEEGEEYIDPEIIEELELFIMHLQSKFKKSILGFAVYIIAREILIEGDKNWGKSEIKDGHLFLKLEFG